MTRDAYDAVADSYAELVRDELDEQHLELGLIATFAATAPPGPVLEVGCGTGRVARILHDLGAEVSGIDLSPNMIEIARRTYPHLRFDLGTIEHLDAADESLAGVAAWYSIIHTPPELLPVVFAEFRRVLTPGGSVLLAFQSGNERVRLERAYGHAVSYDAYRLDPDLITAQLAEAGFELTVRAQRSAVGKEPTPQAYLIARRESARQASPNRVGRGI